MLPEETRLWNEFMRAKPDEHDVANLLFTANPYNRLAAEYLMANAEVGRSLCCVIEFYPPFAEAAWERFSSKEKISDSDLFHIVEEKQTPQAIKEKAAERLLSMTLCEGDLLRLKHFMPSRSEQIDPFMKPRNLKDILSDMTKFGV